MWNEECIEVYKAWSIKKKLWKTDDPKKITKAKHRLITALRRNPEIEMLEKESTFYRFRIVQQNTSEDRKVNYEDKTCDKNTYATKMEHVYVNKKTPDKTDLGDRDMKNVLAIRKENIDSSLFSNSETTLNSPYPLFLSEIFENTPKMYPVSDIFNEELHPADTKSEFGDKCCCEVLLDNYLCNQKCIWHGMPP